MLILNLLITHFKLENLAINLADFYKSFFLKVVVFINPLF